MQFKLACFVVFLIIGTCGAQTNVLTATNRAAVISTNSITKMPEEFSTRDGKTYTSVRLQQAYPNEIIISYRRADNVRDLDNIKLSDLPGDLQKFFHYDPANAKTYEAAQAVKAEALKLGPTIDSRKQWAEYYSAIERRKMEADQDAIEAERKYQEAALKYQMARQRFEDELKIQSVQAQQRAADAQMMQAVKPAPSINIENRNTLNVW